MNSKLDYYIPKIYNILIPMLMFGVPIQAIIPVFLNIPSNPINFGFRLSYAVLSLGLIVLAIVYTSSSYKNLSLAPTILIFLFFLYSIRLTYDVSIRHIKFDGGNDIMIYGYGFGNCFLPSISIVLNRKRLNIEAIVKNIYIFIILVNVLVLSMILFQNNGFSANLFLQRVSVRGVESNLLLIHTILIGFYGAALVTSTYYVLSFGIDLKNKWLFYLLFLLGISNLILSASRGPFFFTILLLTIITILRILLNKTSVLSFLLGLLIGIVIITSFSTIIFSNLNDGVSFEDLTLVNRVLDFKASRENKEKEERDYEWESAIRQFKENPIIGDQFVTKYDGFEYYPHNIYIEFLMSLGLIGGILYTFLIFFQISNFFKLLKLKNKIGLFLYIYFILFFMHSSLSGCVFISADFWTIFTTSLVVFNTTFNKQNKNLSNPLIDRIQK